MNSNAVNAMLAHRVRAGDDNTFVRSIIEGYAFLTWGVVEKYEEGHVDVKAGSRHFTNVEVLILGVNGWGIKPVLAKDDKVLLLTTQAPVPDVKEFEAPGTMPPYDLSGMKAIPITTDETAQLITVSADGIEIAGKLTLQANDEGITVTTPAGDDKVNTVDLKAEGITLSDGNGNSIATSDKGITATDCNDNTIITADKKIELEVKGGSKIAASDSSVIINGALEIKKS